LSDPYFSLVEEQWPNIFTMYHMYNDKKPVILFDIQEERLYAYSYDEFKAKMNPGNQPKLEEQYREATANSSIVVFVRDNDQRKLVSYALAPENPQPEKKRAGKLSRPTPKRGQVIRPDD
jgi:hypothetical protein